MKDAMHYHFPVDDFEVDAVIGRTESIECLSITLYLAKSFAVNILQNTFIHLEFFEEFQLL